VFISYFVLIIREEDKEPPLEIREDSDLHLNGGDEEEFSLNPPHHKKANSLTRNGWQRTSLRKTPTGRYITTN
jgi:hypothetical protein